MRRSAHTRAENRIPIFLSLSLHPCAHTLLLHAHTYGSPRFSLPLSLERSVCTYSPVGKRTDAGIRGGLDRISAYRIGTARLAATLPHSRLSLSPIPLSFPLLHSQARAASLYLSIYLFICLCSPSRASDSPVSVARAALFALATTCTYVERERGREGETKTDATVDWERREESMWRQRERERLRL